jgi:hypothetical protein
METHSENKRVNTIQKIKKQGKVVPELIFHMEQLDVELISLSKTVLDRSTVTKFIKPSAARDFRIQEKSDDEDDKGGKSSNRKRKDTRESGGANKKSKEKNRDNDE